MKLRHLLAAVFLTTPFAIHAQNFPTKPVRIIVPNPAGGTVDLLPRLIGEKLQAKWGQPVIVENRPGAAGNIGADAVFRSEADGHTLLVAPPPSLVINQYLYPKLSFNASQFVPVTILGSVPNALLVPASSPISTVAEFIAHAQAKPGKLTYASQGSGSTSHLTAELFKTQTSTNLLHIPYKGSAPAMNDLMGGHVDAMFDNLGASMQYIKAGRMKLLGVSSPDRVSSLPDAPTIAETVKGFAAVTWFGVVAPPGTPAATAEKIQADIREAMNDAGVKARMRDMSVEPSGITPAQTAAFLKEESDRWHNVIRTANVKLD